MNRRELLSHYDQTRKNSLALTEPLSPEEFRIQSIPDVSPPWWNLAHTSWFFSKNILEPAGLGTSMDQKLEFVLNSYYDVHGDRMDRHRRGLLSRPNNQEVLSYRLDVDQRISQLTDQQIADFETILWTGIQHEQQHQELLLSEIKHISYTNPRNLRTPYRPQDRPKSIRQPSKWQLIPGGDFFQGASNTNWAFDNELPTFPVKVSPFEIQTDLVTCGEYLDFIEDDGYSRSEFWLDNAKPFLREWGAPLYWEKEDRQWFVWSLSGFYPLDPEEAVCHVSFYEADAFARWRKSRLPTESEWEYACDQNNPTPQNLQEDDLLNPVRLHSDDHIRHQIGTVWEWTWDAYRPYPGYQPFAGNLTEYNGKFMDGQYVLRGGSFATPKNHIRPSYRNYWHPTTRFQFSGIRLARTRTT